MKIHCKKTEARCNRVLWSCPRTVCCLCWWSNWMGSMGLGPASRELLLNKYFHGAGPMAEQHASQGWLWGCCRRHSIGMWASPMAVPSHPGEWGWVSVVGHFPAPGGPNVCLGNVHVIILLSPSLHLPYPLAIAYSEKTTYCWSLVPSQTLSSNQTHFVHISMYTFSNLIWNTDRKFWLWLPYLTVVHMTQ